MARKWMDGWTDGWMDEIHGWESLSPLCLLDESKKGGHLLDCQLLGLVEQQHYSG